MQEAQTAREQTNGYKLDRSHVFVVNMFDDFDKYMKVPDEWVPPESKPYTPGVIFFILCYYWPYTLETFLKLEGCHLVQERRTLL